MTTINTNDEVEEGISLVASDSNGLKRRGFLKGVASSAALIPLLGVEGAHADSAASASSAATPSSWFLARS